jgi:CHASE3 domain sensor protein
MPALKTKKLNEKISDAAEQAKDNPYITKIIEDKELRENAVAALQSVKSAFDSARETGFDKPAELISDKSIKKDLKNAAETLKETSDEIASAGKKKRHPLRKLVVIGVIGAVVAIVASEDVRKTVLDTLFGAEEEFEYTSSTTASAGSSTNGTS